MANSSYVEDAAAYVNPEEAAAIWDELRDNPDSPAHDAARSLFRKSHAPVVRDILAAVSLPELSALSDEDFQDLHRIASQIATGRTPRKVAPKGVGRREREPLTYVGADGCVRLVRQARESKGWQLDDLGEAIAEVGGGANRPSKGTLSAIENGKRGVSDDMARTLEAALGLPRCPRSTRHFDGGLLG